MSFGAFIVARVGRTTRITCLVHVICHIYDMSYDVRVGLAYGYRSVRRLWWLIGRLRLSSGGGTTCLVHMICHMDDTSYDVRVGLAYGCRSVRRLWWLIGRLRFSSGSDHDMSCAHVMFMSSAHVLFVGVPGRPTVPEHQRT